MIKFDSEAFIEEMESLDGVIEEKFDYNFNIDEYEGTTERELKNDI